MTLRARRLVVSRVAKRPAPRMAIAFTAVLALMTVFLMLRLTSPTGGSLSSRTHQTRTVPATAAQSRIAWTDTFGDGTPDFLRLNDAADQAAFRRWFTLIAEYQAIRPRNEVPAEIVDCASLLRYSYREAFRRHDELWFMATGIEVAPPPGEIRAWQYPNTPLGRGLFRVEPGDFQDSDVTSGAFAEFADAKTLVERNAFFVSRDVRAALPGDLLFYRQLGHSSPWHSMIVAQAGPDARVVYDTGPNHGEAGELRRVAISELIDHPEPEWRPLPANPNFLGVYRWNILRGTQ
ncbi:DUF1175 domain-containing protein [Occallatibacter riparius]|uniref:DUF1175 domain-containing protein n=1 Tax=Occallatibacter riparius TaxID=1002689 RepID=A0A9J7BHL1_9BACT|nr:DUF1175 domain-containing protein [Occallatibacter riparius]UWZ82280.1 DUF1175 domain-containing protein [Occallatibacter riparius]